ncbi:type II toxin-antitoxin system RelE/ParE family toxin [Roseospira navarrensis]|uniref:type II toxin-antitoxin system RelE/ParE family toxin n=1 Tax=Roseospira navarrensis TaxID=140058 RepID=UPI001B8834C9
MAESALRWASPALKALKAMPNPVRETVSFALVQARMGLTHLKAKPMKGLGPGVFEVALTHKGDAYRLIYTTRVEGVVFVAHCFVKKSTSGIKTPKHIIDAAEQRLKNF